MTELKPVQPIQVIQPVQPNSPQKTYDLFELRLEIIQYTNPLRVKILLLSLLDDHPWEGSKQDWSMLRSHTLDNLLEQLIDSGKSLVEVATKLYEIAKSQKDSEANLQTASTIIEALKFLL